jgi:hypothetical protein
MAVKFRCISERESWIKVYYQGVSQRAIAQDISTSRHFVQDVIQNYDVTNSSVLQQKKYKGRTVLSPNVIDCLEIEKLSKPSIYCSELHNRLVLDGVIHPADLPCTYKHNCQIF